MPAKSDKQKRFMGMVKAYKKGKLDTSKLKNIDAIKKAAKSMSDKDVDDFLKEEHLRQLIKKEILKEWNLKHSIALHQKYDPNFHVNESNMNNIQIEIEELVDNIGLQQVLLGLVEVLKDKYYEYSQKNNLFAKEKLEIINYVIEYLKKAQAQASLLK